MRSMVTLSDLRSIQRACMEKLFRFLQNESGQGLGEYGLLLMLTVIAVVAAVKILAGTIIDNIWNMPAVLGG